MAVHREYLEELGIYVSIKDITFLHLSHRVGRNENCSYYDIYFLIVSYEGTPRIMEPEKCYELEWSSIDHLPEDIIDIRRMAIINYLNKLSYSEIIIK